MSSKTFFLSYDLGLRGDYSGLYYFLDKYDAKECGGSVAIFRYEVDKKTSFDEILDRIKQEIEEYVKINEKLDRIYIMGRDNESGNMKGRFIIGRRKESPWSGYYNSEEVTIDDEI
ncbi:hypothetical protein HX045_01865 [Myroides odoratimimus]|uniref:hypothetical protein n=2 Tax=Myroides odoratimimus TaxID=76832 RepID=UPI00103F5B75|nr:hypothetical protein [Myroides odoratimimus]MCA4791215.1 hypothetical protein [Myroides odoratimimus]MCA4818475.1 hypothetical protein [Myroides odoratimimus]MDM1092109.1 hypothetical protein [Myroides odoratimimus]MDM1325873.1 hypothetical protein [Myroides odoratimimus]MDM1401606.1 hypothetical protein [Myroides odoratimimus]